MKFLAIGDILEANAIDNLLSLDLRNYAFLILTGDMSGSSEGWKIGKARALDDKDFIPKGEDPKRYYKKLLKPSIEKLKKVDKQLGKIQKYLKIFAVYGNTDFKSVVEQVKPRNFTVLHNKISKTNGLYLVGYNGHPMYPWEIAKPRKKDIFGFTYTETVKELNSFLEEQIYDDLKEATKNLPHGRVIILTHTPPYKILDKVNREFIPWAIKSYGEIAKEGNIGSTGLRKFLLEFKPLLHIFGHVHEAKGINKINGTTFVNVGCFNEKLEFVEVEVNKSTEIRFIQIK